MAHPTRAPSMSSASSTVAKSSGPERGTTQDPSDVLPKENETNTFDDNREPTPTIRTVPPEYNERDNASQPLWVPAGPPMVLYDYNEDAVAIRDTGTSRGLGVFVTRNFARHHRIICEPPIFSCTPPVRNDAASRRRRFARTWCSLSLEDQEWLKSHFSKLRHIPTGQQKLTLIQSIYLHNWVLEYAFSNPQRSMVHIYRFGSHINHACRSCANAEQWTESTSPHCIFIKLIENVKAGDEIFINYNRTVGNAFGCAVCGLIEGRKSFFRQFWFRLARWLSGVQPLRTKERKASPEPSPEPSLPLLGAIPSQTQGATTRRWDRVTARLMRVIKRRNDPEAEPSNSNNSG
ncbi:hypothetical protein V8C42DRAFT_340266 [Trichoderma barbatum]